LESTEIDSKIVKWLELEGWQFEKLDEPNYYSLYRTFQNEYSGFDVGIEKKIERVNIFVKTGFTEKDRNSFMLSPDKISFWIDLKEKLMLLGVSTKIDPEDNVDKLKSIELSRSIYFDALTQDKFIDTSTKVTDGLALCNLMWRKFIDSSKNNHDQ
jgi:hypothetical protein